MTTKVSYILGNRKYLWGNFSLTDYHIPFTNLIKIRRLSSKGKLLLPIAIIGNKIYSIIFHYYSIIK